MNAAVIDAIAKVVEETPHIGAETEGIVTDLRTLEVVHVLDGEQPTEAVKRWLQDDAANHTTCSTPVCTANGIVSAITPDIPETTIEANPEPARSSVSSAAMQRLMSILIHTALQDMSKGEAQMMHGAALRPPRVTPADASNHIPPWKKTYYKYQIGVHGDKVAAAAGDHLNLSAPWTESPTSDPHEISRKIFEMTARMRLIAGALSMAISAASPLYFFANGGLKEATFGTSLTQWESARLGGVWANRTIMDIAHLFENPASFQKIMTRFAANGVLKTGRDIWLPVRAQPAPIKNEETFEQMCEKNGIDAEEGEKMLMESFEFGPARHSENPYYDNPKWKAVEEWRQRMLKSVIETPRNRVEVRTLETPPAFDDVTPYEYIKSIHAFLELLFIYLSQNPDFVQNLEYGPAELQAAKHNEIQVLLGGLDANIYWIPTMKTTTPRAVLKMLLEKIEDLSSGLGRNEDLELIRQIVDGGLLTPAARIRESVGKWYDINIENRQNPRMLQDDSFAQNLFRETRRRMPDELKQIEKDLDRMPSQDREKIRQLLEIAKTIILKTQ